eukprot:TRINITY_DN6674_c0_g2_i1.p1 TRINITY_DN6674_c0_g2~~TRINITY_DN6674_c0_g2_i1.p1  ORF type:complete len:373 (+),score=53.81 TRINITY_DN6674_c0_g2_i1:710-1828(+)
MKRYETERHSPVESDYSYLLNTEVSCDIAELRNLEVKAISWLQEMGIIMSGSDLTLKDIEKDVRNGTILCELANVMSKTKIKMYNSPKTDSAALYNIRKAFDVFRKLPRISHKHLWSEREVYNGDIAKILHLLNDLHNYHENSSATHTKREITSTLTRYYTSERFGTENSCNEGYNELSFREHKVGKSEASVKTISNSPLTNAFEINTFTKTEDQASNQLQSSILDWVQQVLRKNKKCKELPKEAEAFRDGVALAYLVEALEHKEIEGINFNPKTSAAALNNIRRVLGVLKNNWKIPLTYIYSEQEIHNGNHEIIDGLLKSIKNAYNSNYHRRSKSVSRANKSQERAVSPFNDGTNKAVSYTHLTLPTICSV